MRQVTRRSCTAITLLGFLLTLASSPRTWAAEDPLIPARGQKAVVLLFVATDCPISNSYAPEIRRLCARYTPEHVAFRLVYADVGTSRAAAGEHAREYGYPCPLVLDPRHRLVHRTGATVTPEAAVFGPGGRLLYRGRIDDRYVSWGKPRFRATRHDLREALDAVLSGRPVPTSRTPAIGCFI